MTDKYFIHDAHNDTYKEIFKLVLRSETNTFNLSIYQRIYKDNIVFDEHDSYNIEGIYKMSDVDYYMLFPHKILCNDIPVEFVIDDPFIEKLRFEFVILQHPHKNFYEDKEFFGEITVDGVKRDTFREVYDSYNYGKGFSSVMMFNYSPDESIDISRLKKYLNISKFIEISKDEYNNGIPIKKPVKELELDCYGCVKVENIDHGCIVSDHRKYKIGAISALNSPLLGTRYTFICNDVETNHTRQFGPYTWDTKFKVDSEKNIIIN